MKPSATPTGRAALGTTQTLTVDDITATATVYQVRTIKSRADMTEPSRRFIGIDAKVCIRATDSGPIPISTQPWSIDYADDTSAEPIGEWWDGEFPVPLYPASRSLNAGQCIRGWVMFKPLKGQAVRVTYTPATGGNASWRIH